MLEHQNQKKTITLIKLTNNHEHYRSSETSMLYARDFRQSVHSVGVALTAHHPN